MEPVAKLTPTLTVSNKEPTNPEQPDPMKPRPLSREEIEDILTVVPRIKSAAEQVGEYNRESLLRTLREQLSEIVVTPLAIQDIKDEIVRQFNEAVVKPGSVVGVTAAEALGQPITQMALNSFHQSGSSKNVTFGINRVRELIYATKELKNTSCSIFFKNQHLTFDDIIIKVRPVLTEINVNDLVKGLPDVEQVDQLVEPWWYQPYRMFIRNDFHASYVLILDIDVDMLFAYKITMKDIARVIEEDQSVICVYSPMNIGQIHVYPIEKTITTKIKSCTPGVVDGNNASMIFLHTCVISALDKLTISGMSGINQIYPVEAVVWQIVKEEKKHPTLEHGWFLLLNEVRMKITGITRRKLEHLCQIAGMKIFKRRDNYIGVTVPETAGNETPGQLVQRLIKADKEDEKAYEEQKRKEGARVIRRPPTEIMTASQLVYADSDGSLFKGNKSTLRKLLAHPDIDSTRTYCNNVHEINAVLGIEAARSFLIKEFSDVIGHDGSYVNPRHIFLLVDFMVSLGQVNGITFTGISRQPIGALEKASFEKAFDTFKEASGFGESKSVKGTSASIYVGRKAEIGTGYSTEYMDTTKFKNVIDEIDTNPDMKLDIGAFKDAIGEMTDIISGADIMIMEGAEEEMFATGGMEEPLLPQGMVIPGIAGNPDPRAAQKIKGPLIRAPELTQAALKLNEAPCLVGPARTEVRVEDIRSPLVTDNLPTMVGVTQPTQLINKPVTTGPMGLPDLLKQEMEEFTYAEPPKVATAPATGLPGVLGGAPLPVLAPTTQTQPVPTTQGVPTNPIMFDLETF